MTWLINTTLGPCEQHKNPAIRYENEVVRPRNLFVQPEDVLARHEILFVKTTWPIFWGSCIA